ncbi:MarR family winged helix-turn-helix transcriptional regulator [Halorubellus salinus]|uniref:MarR family winged helix-turn-helix transcriptional regulator n=1 Tax=Halorubellus salinus TaxID=755309 RepID=UPI0022237B06|nr:MarR family winged helix-turn-helix transcriptional regulator [Halorubellus salinus]
MTDTTPPTTSQSNQPTTTTTSEPQLRFDNLSGFQRDILRTLYALQATHPQASEPATSIREHLRAYPHYTDDEPSSSRFYPTTLRLNDRGWIHIQPDLEDARRRHYHLTKTATTLLDAITSAEPNHPNTSQPAPHADPDTNGGDPQ